MPPRTKWQRCIGKQIFK